MLGAHFDNMHEVFVLSKTMRCRPFSVHWDVEKICKKYVYWICITKFLTEIIMPPRTIGGLRNKMLITASILLFQVSQFWFKCSKMAKVAFNACVLVAGTCYTTALLSKQYIRICTTTKYSPIIMEKITFFYSRVFKYKNNYRTDYIFIITC